MPGPRRRSDSQRVNVYARMVRDAMESQGWNPNQLSTRTGLPRATVYKAVKDKPMGAPPDDDTISRLCRYLPLMEDALRWAVAESLGLVAPDVREKPAKPGVPTEGLRRDQVSALETIVAAMRVPIAEVVPLRAPQRQTKRSEPSGTVAASKRPAGPKRGEQEETST